MAALQHPLFSSTTEGEGNSSSSCWRYRVSFGPHCDLKYLYFLNSIVSVAIAMAAVHHAAVKESDFFLFFSFISLIADGPHHYHSACGHKGSSNLSPVHALQLFLSRCKFSTLTTRQAMVEFYLLTFPRFPLRK